MYLSSQVPKKYYSESKVFFKKFSRVSLTAILLCCVPQTVSELLFWLAQ